MELAQNKEWKSCTRELAHALLLRSTELCLQRRCGNERLFGFCWDETVIPAEAKSKR